MANGIIRHAMFNVYEDEERMRDKRVMCKLYFYGVFLYVLEYLCDQVLFCTVKLLIIIKISMIF